VEPRPSGPGGDAERLRDLCEREAHIVVEDDHRALLG
jgi:hypothetical protein